MYFKFSSDITRLGPILTPYVLEINDYYVKFSKRNKYLLNKDTVTMPIDVISSIYVNASLLGTDVIINGYGGVPPIVIKKMNIKDAYLVQEILNNKKTEILKNKRR